MQIRVSERRFVGHPFEPDELTVNRKP